MRPVVTVALLVLVGGGGGSFVPRAVTLEARRWWNVSGLGTPTQPVSRPASQPAERGRQRVELSGDRHYALLFFGRKDSDLLRRLSVPLNRLDARREWVVLGLSPDDPNVIGALVYRHRLRFGVGAGSRAQGVFGVGKLPCLVVWRAGDGSWEVREGVEEAVRGLVGVGSMTQPGGVRIPEDRRELGPQTPEEVLRAAVVAGRTTGVRVDAARLLKERLSAEEFRVVLDEMLSVDPPELWNEDFGDRAIWYSGKVLWLAESPEVAYECVSRGLRLLEDPPSWEDWALAVGYQLALREKESSEIMRDYLAHLGESETDLMVRKAVIRHLDELPADQVVPLLTKLLGAESDVCYRKSLVYLLGWYWAKAEGDWTDVVVGALESALRPEEHLAVRVTAEQMLQMIANAQEYGVAAYRAEARKRNGLPRLP